MLDGINEIVKRYYPMCSVKQNQRNGEYEVYEEIYQDTIKTQRKLWTYENDDGTKRPCIADKVVNWLKRADTRNWCMQDRVKVWDKEDKEEEESREREASNLLQSIVIEDYDHIAGIKTFFCNPAFKYTKEPLQILGGK